MHAVLAWLFDTNTLTPHGFCLLWRPDLIWSSVVADSIVAASYFSIPVALTVFVLKRRDLAFPWVFVLFSGFILLCGSTHIMEAVTFWVPAYGLETALKIATALVSFATAAALWPMMPRALALPSVATLTRLNNDLAAQIEKRERIEAELRDTNIELEARVARRTAQLTQLTEELRAEVAERQRIEQGLRETGDLLQATFEAAPFPISVVAPDGTVIFWNRTAEQVFGDPTATGAEKDHFALVPARDQAELDEYFRRAGTGETLSNISVRRLDRQGRLRDISFSCAPVRYSDGRVRALVYALEDMTQRNATEAQLRQAQKMEAIGNLTGGIAHDFNNLLGIIIGNLDSLHGDIANNTANYDMVRDALDAALRGADLTSRLLAFARRQPLSPEAIGLNVLVDRSLSLLNRTLGAHIQVDVEFAVDIWPALVDPVQLEAAIANLATNARDAMPRGGKLIVRTLNASLDDHYVEAHPEATVGDYACIEVCDTGTGIPPALLGRIFEPFFTTKPEGKGSGLGLAMVFGFMKQTGGHINVYSEIGKGTCFRLYLPRASNAPGVTSRARPAAMPEPLGRETVLVVEDSEKLRRVVVRQISSLGYTVYEAEDGAAALEIVRQGIPIDLLFTDIVMPGEMSGADLATAASSLITGLKVLFTSGFPEARAETGGWLPGNSRLLAKPYRRDELARALRQALDG